MSLKRRMKRAVEKRLNRGEIALANGDEVSYKPVHPTWYSRLPPAGREAIVRLNAAVNQDEPADATLQELEHLIETYPFAPVFYNYLAIAYSRRGMHELADRTIDRVLQRVPDYLFARLNRAEHLLWSGDDAQILSLLGPTLELRDLCPGRTRYHVSEFAGYYAVVAIFESRRGNLSRDAAILAMLQAVAPGERSTDALADELQSPRLLRRLARFAGEMKPADGGAK
jgi:tetratricopeptide (TPR) repeat protein